MALTTRSSSQKSTLSPSRNVCGLNIVLCSLGVSNADHLLRTGTDFTFDAIDLAYGDILDLVPAKFQHVNTPTTTPKTIRDHEDIEWLGLACMLHVHTLICLDLQNQP